MVYLDPSFLLSPTICSIPDSYYYNVSRNLLIRSISPLYYVKNLPNGFKEQQIPPRNSRQKIHLLNAEKVREKGCDGVCLKPLKVPESSIKFLFLWENPCLLEIQPIKMLNRKNIDLQKSLKGLMTRGCSGVEISKSNLEAISLKENKCELSHTSWKVQVKTERPKYKEVHNHGKNNRDSRKRNPNP
ncbi:hypothetical protein C922_01745 [Plasmodium inui San Antonio 1]|uniref:Uncharacterized protein n=1 Tax=Plasmodium inui San Antonio 1 TaxID=1237626 RepID=W7A7I9_9APIC|nr:hypothetical protein C922_01745 [Plasmodium inui San Antonio 1]EUD67560.1 hypothetical protein C922_01745 [Plasmodium inui San Antonio 1]